VTTSKGSSLCASSNVPILFTNDDEPSRNKGIDEVSQKIAFYSAGSTSKRKALFLVRNNDMVLNALSELKCSIDQTIF